MFQRYVRGSGQNGTGYTLSYDDSDDLGIAAHALLIQTQNGRATAMGLADSGTRFFIGDANATFEPLTLVDASTIVNMPIMSLPYEVEYTQIVDTGSSTVVASPINGDFGSARVFYGAKEDMQQRPVTSVEFGGALSAPTRTVHFLVGTQELQVVLGGSEFPPPPDAGTTSDAAVPDELAGLVFYCLTA